jgi:hypothetical protein
MSNETNKLENIIASFNASTLPLRQRTVDHVLVSKIEGWVVFFLNESKDQLTGFREFESYEAYEYFLFTIPMKHPLIIVNKEDNYYTTGIRFSDESWSHKYDGEKVEMAHYNSENFPVEINVKYEFIKMTRSLLSKIS